MRQEPCLPQQSLFKLTRSTVIHTSLCRVGVQRKNMLREICFYLTFHPFIQRTRCDLPRVLILYLYYFPLNALQKPEVADINAVSQAYLPTLREKMQKVAMRKCTKRCLACFCVATFRIFNRKHAHTTWHKSTTTETY